MDVTSSDDLKSLDVISIWPYNYSLNGVPVYELREDTKRWTSAWPWGDLDVVNGVDEDDVAMCITNFANQSIYYFAESQRHVLFYTTDVTSRIWPQVMISNQSMLDVSIWPYNYSLDGVPVYELRCEAILYNSPSQYILYFILLPPAGAAVR